MTPETAAWAEVTGVCTGLAFFGWLYLHLTRKAFERKYRRDDAPHEGGKDER